MTKEALKLALEALQFDGFTPEDATHHHLHGIAIIAIKEALAQPEQEPIGYLFQHEETGLTTIVDVQQVEWGFEKNNPRHQKIGLVYTTPPATQRKPLTLDELKALWNSQADQMNQWDELGIDEIVAFAQAAHGIKENT
jgi:hypothetical protein